MTRFLLLFTLAFHAFAADLLPPGNQPLTPTIIQNVTSILDWLAGAPLPAEQRHTIEQAMAQSWQQHNAQQISQWVQLSNLRPQLDALNEAQKQNLRATLLAQLKANANPLANAVSTAAGPSMPSGALTGKWEHRSGSSSITYQDRATGSFAAPTGDMQRYVFFPNGEYEYAEMSQVSTYGCTTGYFGYERGGYSINGNRVTFIQRQHSLEFKSNCNSSLNSNKNLPLETNSYFFQTAPGQYGRELILSDGNSKQWRYNRSE